MGTSSDAMLVWGFEVPDDSKDHEKLATLDYTAQMKAQNECGGELVLHCSDACTMFIVGLAKTYTVASRGYPEEIKDFEPPWSAQKKLDAFAAALGVKPKDGKWLLCSWLG